ncbi:signal peptidase I [Solilutibacter silvestris]|uniref:Signal peptidase I n=1 Tax=Solilutibacter silvestris TaxID=1645665 RepID=A0A2K1PXQ6_9GAMM|nr:signal peptidase I [Lysobacter silvestris]PNS07477.1 signal peptidase I [Lysobacter silvestris]
MDRSRDTTSPRRPWWHWRGEWARTAALLLMLGVFRASFANHYVVPSGSMQPTLEPGDRVLVDMRAHGLRVPLTTWRITRGQPVQRGEVVIFDSPADGVRLIKRVVAIGGDTVEVRDGHLRINNHWMADGRGEQERFDARTVTLDLDDGGGPDVPPMRIPQGRLLMMGDHRGNSLDGRFFGLVPEEKVYGRATAVFWRSGEAFVWKRL